MATQKQDISDKHQENPDKHVAYIVINSDLKMKPGKIGSQSAHAHGIMLRLCMLSGHIENFSIWNSDKSRAIVVLTATQDIMLSLLKTYQVTSENNLSGIWCAAQHDAGLTQVAPNSLTAIAFCPMPKSLCPKELASLKLHK